MCRSHPPPIRAGIRRGDKVFSKVASPDRTGALVVEEGASSAARFSHVFTEDATSAEVFERVGEQAVKRLWMGTTGPFYVRADGIG